MWVIGYCMRVILSSHLSSDEPHHSNQIGNRPNAYIFYRQFWAFTLTWHIHLYFCLSFTYLSIHPSTHPSTRAHITHIYMYVCMYVYMYVCMHACFYTNMYVCLYVYVCVWLWLKTITLRQGSSNITIIGLCRITHFPCRTFCVLMSSP